MTRSFVWSLIKDAWGLDEGYSPTLVKDRTSLLRGEFIVYHLINKGSVVYIGSSEDISSRLLAHAYGKVFTEVRLSLLDSKSAMLAFESQEILKELPNLNMSVNLAAMRVHPDLPNTMSSFMEVVKEVFSKGKETPLSTP